MSSALSSIAEIAAAPCASAFGVDVPARFGSLEDECRAVREGAGLFDASFRTWVKMTGEDRVGFLHGMISNDVKGLAPGGGTYAMLLTQQGRVVSDLRVYAAADHLLLDLPANGWPPAQAALERLIVADDVEMEVLDLALMGVEGPISRDLLAALGVTGGPEPLASTETRLAGRLVRTASCTHAGESGVVIGCAAADAATIWSALRAAGAVAVGMEALNVLRIEAGIPWLGVDMDESLLVMEVDLEAAISFDKGCYLGQEVVERIAARGHVNRKRVGLIIDGPPPSPGTRLDAAGEEVGWLTSAVRSPRLATTIGMGYVRREHLTLGTQLTARAGGAMVAVRVAALPLLVRDGRQP